MTIYRTLDLFKNNVKMSRAAKSLARHRGKTAFKKPKPQSMALDLASIGATSLSYNRYDDLSSIEDMEEVNEPNTNLGEILYKPPPIVTDINVPLREIQHLLGNDCVYKRTSIGTKIFPNNKDKFDFCIKSLKEAKIDFHTFNPKEEKLYTTFIYGLPKTNPDDIIAELRTYNLSPVSVVEVKTRYSSDNDAVFKVQFARRSFAPNSLKTVKTIANVIITWKRHKPNNNNKPTQCWNCLMYGHGGQHCNRQPACMTCANRHPTNECPFTKNNKKPAVFSCYNCKNNGYERTDHSANDINCPMRSHYIEIRAKVTAAPTKRNTTIHRRSQNTRVPTCTPTTGNTRHNSEYQQHNNHSYAGVVRNDNNNLFNIDELFNIFTTALDELGKCTTKVQQIQVVMSLLKYAHDIR